MRHSEDKRERQPDLNGDLKLIWINNGCINKDNPCTAYGVKHYFRQTRGQDVFGQRQRMGKHHATPVSVSCLMQVLTAVVKMLYQPITGIYFQKISKRCKWWSSGALKLLNASFHTDVCTESPFVCIKGALHSFYTLRSVQFSHGGNYTVCQNKFIMSFEALEGVWEKP